MKGKRNCAMQVRKKAKTRKTFPFLGKKETERGGFNRRGEPRVNRKRLSMRKRGTGGGGPMNIGKMSQFVPAIPSPKTHYSPGKDRARLIGSPKRGKVRGRGEKNA